MRRQEALARLYGLRADVISAGEAKERWPLMNAEDVIGAVWSPDDGRVSPSDLCAALVKGARAAGARIFENTPVTGIVTRGGRVVAVETAGGTIGCDAVALCAGLWSRKVAALAGAEVPLWPCEHFYLLTRPVEGIEGNLPTLSDHDSHLYIRDDSGGLLVGCFEPLGKPIDPDSLGEDFAFQLLPEDWDHFEPMMLKALHRLPALETAEVRMLLNGPESFTPDGSFLLGETAETAGLFLGCGMNSVGVATGGGAGMALAHAITKGHLPFDLQEADPTRFPACFSSAEVLAARVPEVLGKHYEIAYPHRQWSSARGLRVTPLHARWCEEDAHFGQVAGFERPLFFGSRTAPKPSFGRPDWFEQVGAEVDQAHRHAAIFDQSTFGKIAVRGPDAEAFLDRVCSNRVDREPGRLAYTLMLNPRGGIESDLTVQRLSEESYRLFVGTAALKRDLTWLKRHLGESKRVEIADESGTFAILALMGPEASRIAEDLGAGALNALGYFRHAVAELAGVAVRAARLSYVGEAGWELTCEAAQADELYQALRAAGAKPAGSLAQTSMRIEKRFLAFGHDIDTDLSPDDVGLGFALAMEKDFIGRSAVESRRQTGSGRRLVSVLLDDSAALPLGNEPVLLDGAIAGKTTSAAFGYRVGRPVALALIEADLGRDLEGAKVQIDIAGQSWSGTAKTRAVFDPKGERMKTQSQ